MNRDETGRELAIHEPTASYSAEFVHLPLFDLEVAAGDGAVLDRENVAVTLAFRRDWLHREGLHAHALVLLQVAGDSMEPSLRDRDVILVDRSDRAVRSDRVYVIRVDGEAFVKRLRRDGDSIRVLSDNQAYLPWLRHRDEIAVLGRVVWFGRKML